MPLLRSPRHKGCMPLYETLLWATRIHMYNSILIFTNNGISSHMSLLILEINVLLLLGKNSHYKQYLKINWQI